MSEVKILILGIVGIVMIAVGSVLLSSFVCMYLAFVLLVVGAVTEATSVLLAIEKIRR